MPRRRPAQPPTPENLPPVPSGAFKKSYYSYPDTVYYLRDPSDTEWSRGVVDASTSSTTIHLVYDEEDGLVYRVYAQYIRKRAEWD